MRKIFEYFGLICLICFSFFITEKTSNVIQEIDTIMIKIKEEKDNYYVSGMSAKITDKFIVPGLAYKEVNVGKSYDVMSKKGIYDESFYVYNLIEPEISITNNYDKYIKEGNKEKKMVSLVFMIDNRNILDIHKVVGNTPVSYIIDSYNIDSQVSELAQISKIDSDILINNNKSNSIDGIVLEIPSGIVTNNFLLSSFGPNIPIKISLTGEFESCISTSVEEYGINNALISIYVDIRVTEQITLPFISKKILIENKIPISVNVINGKIPNYYLNGFEKTSTVYKQIR